MKLHLIIYIALAATLAGCAEKQDRELKALVTEMRESYAEGRDSACRQPVSHRTGMDAPHAPSTRTQSQIQGRSLL